ncbi:helix-turn-helix domain-containing protein [Bacteroidales bacterium OttesenSCG-928-L03]|nr:helix-turn-helix domain-containing protein [Bacteroidales bacterium OttesenSCG-928-L03]
MNKTVEFYIAPLDQAVKPKAEKERHYIELILVSSGYVLREYYFNPIRINREEIHLSTAPEPVFISEMEPGTQGWYCCFPTSFLHSVGGHGHLSKEIDLISSFLFHYPLRLSGSGFQRIDTNFRSIRELYMSKQPDYFLIYIYLLANIYETKKVIQQSNLDLYPARAFTIAKDYSDLLTLHIEQEQGIAFYAEQLNISPNHLNKSVKAVTGKTAAGLLDDFRLTRIKNLLRTTDQPINQIGFTLGLEDPSYFSRFFRKKTGMTPGRFREQR